jgi:hypothetical protein
MSSVSVRNLSHDSSHGSEISSNPKNNMKELIALQAWEMVTRFPSLKKLNFIPSLIGMTWLLVVLTYQITFTYVVVFKQKDRFFELVSNFMHKDYFIEVLVSFALLFILYILIAPLAE